MSEELKIVLTAEDGESLTLYALEETRLSGVDYILAADTEEGDGNCYILKDMSRAEDTEAVYQIVEDDRETEYLLSIFEELLDDVEIRQDEERM